MLRRRLEAADRAPWTPSATSGPPISGFVPIFQTVSEGLFSEVRRHGVLRSWPRIHREFIALASLGASADVAGLTSPALYVGGGLMLLLGKGLIQDCTHE